ncbi:S-layer homology domain-containing protein [Cohnella sp.]|uniref:S-layer homology domain-containing protein n=1 Tax=Cohnella sp. TaxID=1883426 RepID=UPI00356141CD
MTRMKSVFSLLLAVCVLFGLAGNVFAAQEVKTTIAEDGRVQVVLEFDDIEEAAWAAGYIGKMQSKSVFQGYEDGTFRPNQPVTRVQAIVTAVRLMGLEEEAKAKSPDAKLHFKDAAQIDKRFKSAKGHVIVALENGLFDTSEDQLQPDKPASRVWVARLLVKSLGLQAEALREMTTIPDFKDANHIPAGSVGYINVAVEHGIVSGYPDGSFKPNKNVTRAEMASLLDRTNDGLLENSGAIHVSGKVHDLDFDDVSVTSNVYHSVNGQITIDSFTGESLSYGISSELLVQYHTKFIRADQLAAGDPVSLVVKDQIVIEASLLDNKDVSDTVSAILKFEVDMEMGNDQEYKLKYKNKNGNVEAEVEQKSEKDKEELKGKEAIEFIENILQQANLSEQMTRQEIMENILSLLEIEKDELKELKIEIKFSNGKKLEIEFEHNDDDDDKDHD